MTMRTSRILGAPLVVALASLGSCGGKSELPDKPLDIEIAIVDSTKPFDPPSSRLPITFDATQDCKDKTSTIACFTINLRLRNYDLTTRLPKNAEEANASWVRLSLDHGTIVSTSAPAGTEVAGANVHLVNGEAKGIVIKVVGAYGDTRIVAQDVGYVPAPAGTKLAKCADGIDNDGNGFADYPDDPGCFFLNDDTEGRFEGGYGVSSIIGYQFPRIWDAQGGFASASPFNARQVDMPGTGDVKMIVTAVTNDGMYVTDITETRPGANSVFVFNFNAPYGVRACDRLTRLAGNVSEFFGFTELGTPGWSNAPWLTEAKSGPCPIPDFVEVTDALSASLEKMNGLESSLVKVKGPVIGPKFGPAKAPGGACAFGSWCAGNGASNCDLNGDGIVGFSTTKAGFRDDEKACNDSCSADPECTEWNSFRQFSEVKITFGPSSGMLFLDPGQIPTFDSLASVGPDKFVEIRGVIRRFLGPTPPNIIIPRCEDDVVTAKAPLAGKDILCLGHANGETCFTEGESCSFPIKCGSKEGTFTTTCQRVGISLKYQTVTPGCESSKACVRPRVGEDLEGTN